MVSNKIIIVTVIRCHEDRLAHLHEHACILQNYYCRSSPLDERIAQVAYTAIIHNCGRLYNPLLTTNIMNNNNNVCLPTSGEFGTVYHALLTEEDSMPTAVAVKTLKGLTDKRLNWAIINKF